MAEPPLVCRDWTQRLGDTVRMRCGYTRRGQHLISYVVQLALMVGQDWRAVVRYDNAHGSCHCDTLHADGTAEKQWLRSGSAGATFTWAIRQLRSSWREHEARFSREVRRGR